MSVQTYHTTRTVNYVTSNIVWPRTINYKQQTITVHNSKCYCQTNSLYINHPTI